jgi:hypothetical protein
MIKKHLKDKKWYNLKIWKEFPLWLTPTIGWRGYKVEHTRSLELKQCKKKTWKDD